MKLFPKDLQTYLPENHRARLRYDFAKVKAEAERRLEAVPVVQDNRKGFATVYATGPIRRSSVRLSGWNWRHVENGNYPISQGVHRFVDDPLGAAPTDSLAARTRVAKAFVEAAYIVFDRDDVQFVGRPIEVVATTEGAAPGFHTRNGSDVLVFDLMLELSNPKVIDRLMLEVFTSVRNAGGYCDAWHIQADIWHAVMRINAARAMLAPTARMVNYPERSSLKRRLDPLWDEVVRAARAAELQ